MRTPKHFLSFEGLDNCGKTTQIEKLSAYLAEKEIPFIVAREPGGTAYGDTLRMVLKHPRATYAVLNTGMANHSDFRPLLTDEETAPLAELLGFLGARANFLAKIVEPSLEQGVSVIADRHIDSTVAYQGYGSFQGKATILELIDLAHTVVATTGRGILCPTRTFFLDIGYDTMVARAKGGLDAFERRGRNFFARVRGGYRKIAEQDGQRVVTIDGTLTPERIFQEIKVEVDGLYNL